MTTESAQSVVFPPVRWGRILLAILIAIFIGWGFLAMTSAGKEEIARKYDPANMTLLEKADYADFKFAYQRNTTTEAVANAVMATKNEYVTMTAYVIYANPDMPLEEAARQAVFEIQRRNALGQSLPQE